MGKKLSFCFSAAFLSWRSICFAQENINQDANQDHVNIDKVNVDNPLVPKKINLLPPLAPPPIDNTMLSEDTLDKLEPPTPTKKYLKKKNTDYSKHLIYITPKDHIPNNNVFHDKNYVDVTPRNDQINTINTIAGTYPSDEHPNEMDNQKVDQNDAKNKSINQPQMIVKDIPPQDMEAEKNSMIVSSPPIKIVVKADETPVSTAIITQTKPLKVQPVLAQVDKPFPTITTSAPIEQQSTIQPTVKAEAETTIAIAPVPVVQNKDKISDANLPVVAINPIAKTEVPETKETKTAIDTNNIKNDAIVSVAVKNVEAPIKLKPDNVATVKIADPMAINPVLSPINTSPKIIASNNVNTLDNSTGSKPILTMHPKDKPGLVQTKFVSTKNIAPNSPPPSNDPVPKQVQAVAISDSKEIPVKQNISDTAPPETAAEIADRQRHLFVSPTPVNLSPTPEVIAEAPKPIAVEGSIQTNNLNSIQPNLVADQTVASEVIKQSNTPIIQKVAEIKVETVSTPLLTPVQSVLNNPVPSPAIPSSVEAAAQPVAIAVVQTQTKPTSTVISNYNVYDVAPVIKEDKTNIESNYVTVLTDYVNDPDADIHALFDKSPVKRLVSAETGQ